ncbi:FxSxx-COOH cyclophane-containing RiPP peptide [Spirillospora albida]|uniref:FxSxx-COOH cyclophane-containing RiPP peptide n=1 Tax=Spirillospora albida TaxID=58123 RepID=UPI0004C0A6CB|nr:FxSxx-COOH cyclophane-containing RiPP peptide [Spirillospora albida]
MEQQTELRSELPDVSGLSLRDLDELDNSVFSQALRSLLDPSRRDADATARFSAYGDPLDFS